MEQKEQIERECESNAYASRLQRCLRPTAPKDASGSSSATSQAADGVGCSVADSCGAEHVRVQDRQRPWAHKALGGPLTLSC